MTNATLKVLRVNFDSGEGPIIFVHANGVQRHTWDVNIYVFSENALKRSVVSLVETNLALTDFEQRQFSSYYDTYQRGVKTYTFSKSSNLTVAEYLDQEAKH